VGDLVFIGDVHLDDDDPHLPAFLELLDDLASSASRVVFLGDLFNLWIGRRELARSHQIAVAGRLRELRARGVVVRYIEGNRDFRVGECFGGDLFDDVSNGGIEERFGGRRIWAIHGDLANAADRQYRAWRRLSRTSVVWWLFNLVPRRRRLRLAEAAETRMRTSNTGFKRAFPEEVVRAYGRSFLREPGDIVVLGHFHVEKDLRLDPPGVEGRVLVLPEWRSSRRHLRVTDGGAVSFIDS